MRAIYVDTSVLVEVFFEKLPKDSKLLRELRSADELLSSNLIEAEFLSVIKREEVDLSQGVAFLKQISLVVPDRSLTEELRSILKRCYLRGADAFHLACALYLDHTGKDLIFATADKKQGEAAKLFSFTVLG